MWKIISGMLEIKLDISNNASNYHDFFTFAINNIEGKILLTCLSYALYQSKIKGFAERSELTPEVKKEFDQLLDKKDFYEITVSILSSNLLLYLDEEWIKTKIKILFPENDQHLWKIAWESYISYQNLNPITYKLLKKHYLKAVLEYKEFTFSDKAIEGLGSHIILLYIHDLEDLENCSRAMWFNLHIWEKYKNTSQEQEVLVKILELWEFRINQIKSEESLKIEDYNRELGWYLMLFEKLPTQGRQIEILADILELTEGKAGTTSIFILDKLSKYVEIDPHNVLRIIKVLLIGSEQYFYLTEEAKILEIIEKIVKLKGLEEFKREVIHIAEMLLSEGFYGIRKTNFYNELNLSE
jgi:hypothetical protein